MLLRAAADVRAAVRAQRLPRWREPRLRVRSQRAGRVGPEHAPPEPPEHDECRGRLLAQLLGSDGAVDACIVCAPRNCALVKWKRESLTLRECATTDVCRSALQKGSQGMSETFGSAVALSADASILIVGAPGWPGYDADSIATIYDTFGAVFVYSCVNAIW